MSIQLSRRKLCRLAAGIPIALPLYRLSAATPNEGQYFIRVDAAHAQAPLSEGALVLVDTRVSRFEGDGFYVYPDWGKPVIYEVRQEQSGELGFYTPGTSHSLWRMSASHSSARFSGRASGYLLRDDIPAIAARGELVELQVPSLPVA